MLTRPRTTFVGGNNPFHGINARPVPTLQIDSPAMQTPAKPARKNAKRLKDKDYSTAYKPPVAAPTVRESRIVEEAPKVASTDLKVASKQRYLDAGSLVICDDPMPAGRSVVEGKYDAKFRQMRIGQALKCAPNDVGLVSNSLRKFVKVRRIKDVLIRTCSDYGDGLGRVWLLAYPGIPAQKA